MGLLSPKLRSWSRDDGSVSGVTYWCQGCKCTHQVVTRRTDGKRPLWSWNGDVNKPIFGPSVLVTTGHYLSTYKKGDDCWCTFYKKHPDADVDFECTRCHTWVGCNGAQPGQVYFLADCSHELKGQILDIPDLPEYLQK